MEKDIEEMFYPLSEYYRDYDIPMPIFESVQSDDVPEPYRHLLVHEADMTGRLTAFHGESLFLNVIDKNALRGMLVRRVVLCGIETNKKFEFGEIIIHLNRFEPKVRELIEEAKIPLGGIMVNHKVEFISSPSHYLKVTCDDMIAKCLSTTAGTELYGRKNKLTNYQGEVLAEIVEILPPAEANFANEGEAHE